MGLKILRPQGHVGSSPTSGTRIAGTATPALLGYKAAETQAGRIECMGALNTPTPKQQAREVIERLPDTATWEAQAPAVAEGLADAKASRLVDGESVMRWLESWGTDNELPPPGP